MKYIAAVLLYISLICKTLAATYFVDYASGSDGNSGRSASAAWQHCPGDPAATAVAAGTRPSPGDTVAFKGGVIYASKNQINIVSSGSPGNQITYEGSLPGFG